MLNTNARSLCPKVRSLIDCIGEMDAGFAVITEKWLADGTTLGEDLSDLELGSGISALYRNRQAGANGTAYGGVGFFLLPGQDKVQRSCV